MQKKKQNKSIINIIQKNKKIFFLLLLFIFFAVFYFFPKNYTKTYTRGNYEIKETYNKQDKLYTIKIKSKEKEYEYIEEKSYTPKRKIITKITEYKEDNASCIVANSSVLQEHVVCLKEKNYVDYHLLPKILPEKFYKQPQEEVKKYKDIQINLVDDKTYLIWNYKGIYKINKESTKEISLFKNDAYSIDLAAIVNHYFVVANYDQKYNFNTLKVVNLKNDKVSEINLNTDISFDTRILGVYKNNLYLLDEKNEVEYEINIKKKKVTKMKNSGKIYKKNKFETVNINQIISKKLTFENNENYSYKIQDNGIYVLQKGIAKETQISDKKSKKIVYYDNTTIYYIVEDKLYKYDIKYKETEILSYFELNFNYENMIFIYE